MNIDQCCSRFFSPTSLWALATSSNCFRGKAKIALAVSSACNSWVPMTYDIGFSLKFEEIPQKLSFKWSIFGLNYNLDNKNRGLLKNLWKIYHKTLVFWYPEGWTFLQNQSLPIPKIDPSIPQPTSTDFIKKPRHHPLSVLHCYWCSPQRSK